MGRGLLKETVKEIDTMLVFAKPNTVTIVGSASEKGQGVPMTIHETEGSLCGPASSGTSVNEHMVTAGNVC